MVTKILAENELIKRINYCTNKNWKKVNNCELVNEIIVGYKYSSFLISLQDCAIFLIDFNDKEIIDKLICYLEAEVYYSLVAYQYRHLKKGKEKALWE